MKLSNCHLLTEKHEMVHKKCVAFVTVATLPGKPGKDREFENWPEKSLNLKIDQKIMEKSGNFIKLTDWKSPIEQTSHQCWKQNVCDSGLESHACDFSTEMC